MMSMQAFAAWVRLTSWHNCHHLILTCLLCSFQVQPLEQLIVRLASRPGELAKARKAK